MLIRKTYELSDFSPWGGAVSTWETIWNENQLDELESYLTEFHSEGEIDETTLNDILCNESDEILTALEKLSNNYKISSNNLTLNFGGLKNDYSNNKNRDTI